MGTESGHTGMTFEDFTAWLDAVMVYSPNYEVLVSQVLSTCREKWAVYNEWVRGAFGQRYNIDEMALIFFEEEALHTFIGSAVKRNGYKLFNHADDKVFTSPIRSDYHVKYWFLETGLGYRLELMYIDSGFSPLHYPAQLAINEMGTVLPLTMHASFKVPDEEHYGVVVNALQRDLEAELVQKCISEYGRFSYFLPPERDKQLGQFYIKPRVNLRDELEPSL